MTRLRTGEAIDCYDPGARRNGPPERPPGRIAYPMGKGKVSSPNDLERDMLVFPDMYVLYGLWVFPKNSGTPKWMVYNFIVENPIKIDD